MILTNPKGDDHLDSRDLIETLEDIKNEHYADDGSTMLNTMDEDTRELHDAIVALEDEGLEDWQYGAHMIREDCFVAYAEELAEDIGAIDSNATWPNTCIDWERAARELAMDYTTVTFLGYDYYVR